MPWALKTPVRFSAGRNRRAVVGSKSDSPKFPAPCGCCATIGAAAIAFVLRKKGKGDTGKTPFPDFPRACNGYALGNTARAAKIRGSLFVFGALFILRWHGAMRSRPREKQECPQCPPKRGVRGQGRIASLKLDFPIKDAQVCGRYIRRAICGQVKGGKPPYLNK